MWKSDHDLEKRFDRSTNIEVVRYLKQKGPSAHSGLVEKLYMLYPEIGESWVAFEAFRPERPTVQIHEKLKNWCELAHQNALQIKNGR